MMACAHCAEIPARWSDAAGEYVCAGCHAEASAEAGTVVRVEAWRTQQRTSDTQTATQPKADGS